MGQIHTGLAGFLALAQIFCAATAGAQTPPAPGLTPGSFKAYAPVAAGETRLSSFSGKPVPRYASLKHDVVNGRAGPSRDYPVRWTYEREGLPVVIVRESQDWRKIRDPMGDEVWVDKSQLSTERTAITIDAGAVVRAPQPRAQEVVRFRAGAVLALRSCGADWCRITAEGKEGWVRRSLLWGADPVTAEPGNP